MTSYPARDSYRNATTARSYDALRFAGIRGRIGDWLDRRAIGQALRWAQRQGGCDGRILDLPCGTGRITEHVAGLGRTVIGADISFEMLMVARSRPFPQERVAFLQCDGSAIGLRDGAVDCVICIRFMGHIPEDTRISILREFRRIAGNAVVEYSIPSPMTRFVKSLRKGRLFSRLPKRWDWFEFTRAGLQGETARAGMQVVRLWPKLRFLSDSWFVLLKGGD